MTWRRLVMGAFLVVLAAGAMVWWRRPGGGERPRLHGGRPVVSKVERRPLELASIQRASVRATDDVRLPVPARADGESASVLTAPPPATGATVDSGSVVAEVNGRPILALALAVPPFRDVVPASSGPDVVALQDALRAAGLPIDDERGVFGADSQAAVEALFERAGYDPAFVAGSREAYEAGLAAAQHSARVAIGAANESRAHGVADPSLDGAAAAARAAVTAYRRSQGVMVRAREVVRTPVGRLVVVGEVPRMGAELDPGATILTLAAPSPSVTLTVPTGQTHVVDARSVVHVAGAGYEASCTIRALLGREAAPDPTNGDGAGAGGGRAREGEGEGEGDEQDPAPAQGNVAFDLRCTPAPGLGAIGDGYVAEVRTPVAGDGLVVPATAVSSRPDGTAFVQRVDGTTTSVVAVRILAEAGGYVSVRAGRERLDAGDEVRVARR